MHHRDYGDEIRRDPINHQVGKSSNDRHSRLAVNLSENLGVTIDQRKACVQAPQKLGTQTG